MTFFSSIRCYNEIEHPINPGFIPQKSPAAITQFSIVLNSRHNFLIISPMMITKLFS
jgi:hypothetical protein